MSNIEVQNFKKAIAYQTGSIVSQEIVKKQAGNITLFAFSQGQGLSEHTAPFDALVNVLEGEVEIKVSGQPYLVSEGESLLMPAGEPHALLAKKDMKMLLVMIKSQ